MVDTGASACTAPETRSTEVTVTPWERSHVATLSTWAWVAPKVRSYSACEMTLPWATYCSASRWLRIGSCSETSTVEEAAARPVTCGVVAPGAETQEGTAEGTETSRSPDPAAGIAKAV